jgi:hypothetical protein
MSMDRIDELNDTLPLSRIGAFTPLTAKNVYQRHYGFTNANSQQPVIASIGAVSCIIIGIYNPATKEVAMTHVDGYTQIEPTLQVMYDGLGGNADMLEVHLAGGMMSSLPNAKMILNFIDSHDNIEIKSCDLLCNKHEGHSQSLAIDARTGAASNIFMPQQVDVGKNLDAKGLKLYSSADEIVAILEFDIRAKNPTPAVSAVSLVDRIAGWIKG